MKKLPISSVILAGGRAKRFKEQDKGLIKLGHQYLIEYVLSQLRPQVSEVMISANRNLAQYRQFNCRVVTDTIGEYWGPLAGIASALQTIQTDYLLVIPCDSPLLTTELAPKLWVALFQQQADVSVAHDGSSLQPLFALLRRNLLDSLLDYLHSGQRAVRHWYNHHQTVEVDFSESPEMFFNINTPDDLAKLQRRSVCESS